MKKKIIFFGHRTNMDKIHDIMYYGKVMKKILSVDVEN